MTINEDTPRRLTKGRANAMLDIFSLGLMLERDRIELDFGVTFNADGTLDTDAELLPPGDLELLARRLDALAAALDAATIFRQRYT